MAEKEWTEVEFRGERYCVKTAFLRGEELDTPVAPHWHVVDGELEEWLGESHAHAFLDDRGIMRYRSKIGEASELTPVSSGTATEEQKPEGRVP